MLRVKPYTEKIKKKLEFVQSVFQIRIILMRIRIRGSASGMMDPDPGLVLDPDLKIEQIPIFFFLIFSV